MELIDRNDLMKSKIWNCGGTPSDPYYNGYVDALDRVQEVLEQMPTVDAITRNVYDKVCAQFMWERDMAISQLEEHGIAFGCVSPDVVKVVRCKDCKYLCRTPDDPIGMVAWCPRTGTRFLKNMPRPWTETHYCEVGERKDDV